MGGLRSAVVAALLPYAHAAALTYAGTAAIGLVALLAGLGFSVQHRPPQPTSTAAAAAPVAHAAGAFVVPPTLPMPFEPAEVEQPGISTERIVPVPPAPSITVWPDAPHETSPATTQVAEDDGELFAAGGAAVELPDLDPAPSSVDATPPDDLPGEVEAPAVDEVTEVAALEETPSPTVVPPLAAEVMSSPVPLAAAPSAPARESSSVQSVPATATPDLPATLEAQAQPTVAAPLEPPKTNAAQAVPPKGKAEQQARSADGAHPSAGSAGGSNGPSQSNGQASTASKSSSTSGHSGNDAATVNPASSTASDSGKTPDNQTRGPSAQTSAAPASGPAAAKSGGKGK